MFSIVFTEMLFFFFFNISFLCLMFIIHFLSTYALFLFTYISLRFSSINRTFVEFLLFCICLNNFYLPKRLSFIYLILFFLTLLGWWLFLMRDCQPPDMHQYYFQALYSNSKQAEWEKMALTWLESHKELIRIDSLKH
ncbi:hypothetical protein BDF14DRAFT_1481393 [Spinellus fusiger]|nr:hypothetical protein BDF14DRAFT_1481393 [Spinellus fusiger]